MSPRQHLAEKLAQHALPPFARAFESELIAGYEA